LDHLLIETNLAIMSTPPPKAVGDLAPPAPVFSYAQAAKGRTPSAPSSVQSAKSPSGSITPSKESQDVSREIPDISMNGDPAPPNGISEKISKRSITTPKDMDTASSVSTEDHGKASAPSAEKDLSIKPQNIALPISPSNSTSPPTTIPEREDVMNGSQVSAESNSENQTLAPASEGEGKDRGEENSEEVKEQREEKEKPAALKPAPLPTVNFWQQRAKEANQLKTKPVPSMPPSSGSALQSPSTVEGSQVDQGRSNSKASSVKGMETSAETRKKGTRAVSTGAEAERAAANQSNLPSMKGGKKTNEIKSESKRKRFPSIHV
jgi:la-related protein 1